MEIHTFPTGKLKTKMSNLNLNQQRIKEGKKKKYIKEIQRQDKEYLDLGYVKICKGVRDLGLRNSVDKVR